jgi:hypothetical protein
MARTDFGDRPATYNRSFQTLGVDAVAVDVDVFDDFRGARLVTAI